MSNTTDLGLGLFAGWPRPTDTPTTAQKINDGIESACLEIIARIERTKETSADKELIDLSMCLSGLITAWNLASIRAGYSPYPAFATSFDEPKGGPS